MSTLLRVCIVLLLPSFYQCVAEISASERKVLHSRQGGINFNQESIHNFNKRKLLRGPVEDTRNESVGQTLEFSVPALNTAATNSREAVENSILRGTTRRSHLYFGSRRTVGMPVHYPILCFTFIKRIKDYRILKRNMRMLGSTCDWAIAANLANGLRFNSMELDNFAKRNSVRLVHEDYRFTLANLTKIQLWKSVVSDLRDRYSHMWVLDGGMTLQDEHHYNQIVNDWQCGSVGGSPPLVSHPMIKVMGATKILPQSNYFNEYSTTDISMIGDTVVDDKAVLFDIGFLHWLFVEVMEPTIETEKDYSVFGNFRYISCTSNIFHHFLPRCRSFDRMVRSRESLHKYWLQVHGEGSWHHR